MSLDGDNTQLLLDKESHAHQQYLDKQEKDFQLKIQERQFDHEDKLKEKELGWLGRLWGGGDNSSRNITAVLCFILILGASISTIAIYCSTQDKDLIVKSGQELSPLLLWHLVTFVVKVNR